VTGTVDPFPDLATTDDDELERLLRSSEDEADAISARRRALHRQIDALREERVRRMRAQVEAGTLEVPAPSSLERPIFEGTGELPDDHEAVALDLASVTDEVLREQIVELEREEDDISLRRRMLHGRIDILHAERERRRRGLHVEPEELGPILGRKPG
jgi:anti-sigma-K factor RsiG